MHGLDGHASSNLAFLSLAGSFEEARAHLGLNLNVNGHHGRLPAPPALLALFSIVTLVAHQQLLQHPFLPKAGIRRHYRRLPMR